MGPIILLIEDDADLKDYLRQIVMGAGYTVYAVATGAASRQILAKHKPDTVVLDLGLPDIRGEDLCIEIKKMYPLVPIIILTAKDNVSEIVAGFKLGADDYVTKPFQGDELLARIKRRLGAETNAVIQIGNLAINTHTFTVKRGQTPIVLTQTEYKLLHFLVTRHDQVVSREMILEHVWVTNTDVDSRVVDVYIGYLRKKIDRGFSKKLIQSVRGYGYVIR